MSHLQRSLAKPSIDVAHFQSSAVNTTIAEDVGHESDDFGTELPQEDDSSSASSASSASSTGTIIPSSSHKLFARPQGCVSTLFTLARAER